MNKEKKKWFDSIVENLVNNKESEMIQALILVRGILPKTGKNVIFYCINDKYYGLEEKIFDDFLVYDEEHDIFVLDDESREYFSNLLETKNILYSDSDMADIYESRRGTITECLGVPIYLINFNNACPELIEARCQFDDDLIPEFVFCIKSSGLEYPLYHLHDGNLLYYDSYHGAIERTIKRVLGEEEFNMIMVPAYQELKKFTEEAKERLKKLKAETKQTESIYKKGSKILDSLSDEMKLLLEIKEF